MKKVAKTSNGGLDHKRLDSSKTTQSSKNHDPEGQYNFDLLIKKLLKNIHM